MKFVVSLAGIVPLGGTAKDVAQGRIEAQRGRNPGSDGHDVLGVFVQMQPIPVVSLSVLALGVSILIRRLE